MVCVCVYVYVCVCVCRALLSTGFRQESNESVLRLATDSCPKFFKLRRELIFLNPQ